MQLLGADSRLIISLNDIYVIRFAVMISFENLLIKKMVLLYNIVSNSAVTTPQWDFCK